MTNSMTPYQANQRARSLQREAQQSYTAGSEREAAEILDYALALADDWVLQQQIRDDLYRLEFNQEP